MDPKKWIFAFKPQVSGSIDPMHLESIWEVNNQLHSMLRRHKNMISNHHTTKVWDWFKRMSNEYEFVFTADMEPPVSRAFYKLWELLEDGRQLVQLPDTMRVAFLAEGPGGFIEAFWRFRDTPTRDTLFAMTLLSADRRVPQWKISKTILPHIHLERGVDNTGSLYNPANIESLVRAAGEASCDLVTADGGFDFSYDFNNQEVISQQLLYAETYTTFRLQKYGGTFVLKIFDISTKPTILLLQALTEAYDAVHIVKPLTSRPANSERYAVCRGFKGASPETLRWLSNNDFIFKEQQGEITPEFLAQITELNLYYVTRQILYIIKTIVCIEQSDGHPDLAEGLLKLHTESSREWCLTYGLSSAEAVQ